MALWSRRKTQPHETPGDGAPDGPGDDLEPSPEKAQKWFEHARSMADSFNYESALVYYANGVRLDPSVMSAHDSMLELALKHMANKGKPASSREVRQIDGPDPISKFAAAEFAWCRNYENASLATKTLEAAVRAEQKEFGALIADRVLAIARRGGKVKRSLLIQLKDLFSEVGAWNQAIAAGELALQMDPSDSSLGVELRELAAQRAMDQGGYEAAASGAEGGFRGFVKDLEGQRRLEEEESLAGSGSSSERVLQRAKEAYEEDPASPEAINTYALLLKRQATPEAILEARSVYTKGFKATGEYRFRMNSGDLEIQQAQKKVEELVAAIDTGSAGEDLQATLEKARGDLMELEAREYEERAQRYPTDRNIRFRLGQVEFARGHFEIAMESFQKAKDEPRLRVVAGHQLGLCFAHEGWHPEAVAEFREAITSADATESERVMEIRYDLMDSLMDQARAEHLVDHARDALEICSGIARQDITYRDIRERRMKIDELIKELGG